MSRGANRIAWPAVLALLIGALGVLFWYVSGPRTQPATERDSSIPLQILEGLQAEGFARVPPEWDFDFPGDHGPHNAYRTEWWYLTGTLTQADASLLGLQLVFARLALAPQPPRRPSAWATSEVYLGLLTLSDAAGGPPVAKLRTARAALGLAGAEQDPIRIWLGDWQLQRRTRPDGKAADWTLEVTDDDLELRIELRKTKAPILASQLERRSDGPAPPFHLYIQPRVQASGSLRVAGNERPVDGVLSLEHAWGELPLPGGPIARDRFTLHLDDGRDLFCIRTHRRDGSGEPGTSCVLVSDSGAAQVLADDAVRLEPTGYWSSPDSGARYPSEWALRAPGEDLELRLRPGSQDAEAGLWEPVWAGALVVHGVADRVAGQGFMQLSGYDD